MTTPLRFAVPRWTVAVIALTTLAVARGAVAQSVPASDTTLIPLRTELSPSTPEMLLASAGIATAEGVSGAFLGNNIDYLRCHRRKRGVRGGFFTDPCFLYSGDATKTGWFVGSLGGATLGALAMARVRGCPFVPGLARALAGSIIGGLPAVITAATPSAKTPPTRSMLLGSAPILAGLGAGLAVRGCHR